VTFGDTSFQRAPTVRHDPSPTDLEQRVGRALGLAARVVEGFADSGFVDPTAVFNSFGPEKVVAETAMLLHAASGVRERPVVRDRFDELAARLAPHARSRRVLTEIALAPSRAYKLAVPHVLLTLLGHADEAFDTFARSRCAAASRFASDLPPSAHLERLWIQSLWDGEPLAVSTELMAATFLARPFDVLAGARDDVYGLTHLLFYLTDFGSHPPVEFARPTDIIITEIEALLLRFLEAEDYDLAGELLMAWPLLNAPWSPTATFAFRVLTQVEDDVGLLPCGNVDLHRLNALDGADRARYALATAYHTAYVMGFLCAVALRPGRLPPATIDGGVATNGTAEAFRAFTDDAQGHWQPVWASCNTRERAALAPTLCWLGVLQKLRRVDYEALRKLLLAAHAEGLGHSPLVAAATQLLMGISQAAAIAAGH
jgi:hypothetical protein